MELHEKQQHVESKPRFRTLAALGLTAILALTACSGHNPTTASKASKESAAINLEPPTLGLNEMNRRALGEFRNEVDTKRTANILIGWCVGWHTAKDKITVTLNPGLKEYKEGNEEVIMNVFSFVDMSKETPRIVFLNGASSYQDPLGRIDSDLESMVVLASSKLPDGVKTSNLNRPISQVPTQGPDGRWSYTDEESGQPVIKSAVVAGPLTASYINQVCEDMRVGPKA